MNYIQDDLKIYLIFFRYKKFNQFVYEKTIACVPNFTQAILDIKRRAIHETNATRVEVLSITQLTQDELDILNIADMTIDLNEDK